MRKRLFLLLVINLLYAGSCYGQELKYNLSSESFGFQQKTIHHDNFHREVTRLEKWKIGENYASKVTYYSPRKDYAAVDDGFRIASEVEETGDAKYPHKVVSGYLTNEQNVKVEKAFRFITTSSSLTENFFIETSVPSIGRYAEVVCNYYDDNNYDAFEITSNKGKRAILKLKRVKGGKETTNDLYESSIPVNSIKIAYTDKQVRVYCDEAEVTGDINSAGKMLLEALTIDKARPIGMLVSRQHKYEYRVFDVYSIGALRHIESNEASNGIPEQWHASVARDYSYRFLPTLIVAGVGSRLPRINKKYTERELFLNITDNRIYKSNGTDWEDSGKRIGDYGMLYDSKSKRIYIWDNGRLTKQGKGKVSDIPDNIQRFELRSADVTNTESSHCEIAENNDFTINNYNLRRRAVSFKTLLPVSYLDDDNKKGGEALIQFQISTDAGKTRQPLFTIASEVVGRNKVRYHLNRRYISTRPVPKDAKWTEEIVRDDDVDLGKAKLGVWDQWDIYVKEGYMKEHCPLLVVKRNGRVIYRSTLPNTYNIMSGSYIRYGVYKSIYRYDDDSERKRIVYIGDFECTI